MLSRKDLAVTEETKKMLRDLLKDENFAKILEESFDLNVVTLLHGDFSPRNACLRKGRTKLCTFDWELALIGLPQIDVIDFCAISCDDVKFTRKHWKVRCLFS